MTDIYLNTTTRQEVGELLDKADKATTSQEVVSLFTQLTDLSEQYDSQLRKIEKWSEQRHMTTVDKIAQALDYLDDKIVELR